MAYWVGVDHHTRGVVMGKLFSRTTVAGYHVFLLFLLLGGCAQTPITPGVWSHPTLSKDNIESDHSVCLKDAWEKYPEKGGLVLESEAYTRKGNEAFTRCSTNLETYGNAKLYKTNCENVKAREDEYRGAQFNYVEANKNERRNEYAKCMTSKDSAYQCLLNGTKVSSVDCASVFVESYVAGAKWVMFTSSSEHTFYRDAPTISQNGNRMMWILSDMNKGTDLYRKAYSHSKIAKYEIDCTGKKTKLIVQVIYDKNMGKGWENGSFKTSGDEFYPTKQGTLSELMSVTACK